MEQGVGRHINDDAVFFVQQLLSASRQLNDEKGITNLFQANSYDDGNHGRFEVCDPDFNYNIRCFAPEAGNDIACYLLDESDFPYKMTLRHDNRWLILAFQIWCMGCFGDDDNCGVCGGSGWGVL
ncbi:MAG: hypothetical protein EOP49_29765 [Sphingobacteriales bacterium]|nr:MAG: hypothetical protein EOP49_29765 [Sphingobacteriales bacterium]